MAINPQRQDPSIVDPDGPEGKPIAMMESGAILIYLAAKTGRFLPKDDRGKYRALQWLMFQMGGVGPMFGQAHHFLRAAKEQVPYAIERYVNGDETAVRRAGHAAGRSRVSRRRSTRSPTSRPIRGWRATSGTRPTLNDFPNVKRWFDAIGARPAVQRGMAVPAPVVPSPSARA